VKRALIVAHGSGDGPEVVEPLVKDLRRDIPLLRYMQPDPARHDTARLREAAALVGDRGLVLASLYSPIDCREALTQPDFLMLSHDDPGAFREIVEIGGEALMLETEAALASGVAATQVWWFYASPSAGWSPRVYDEMFLPWAVRHVELVHSHGAMYIYYDDGKMGQFLSRYIDTGTDALMTLTPPPMGDADPATMKRCYGDRICLMGGIDVVNEVYLSTPERIRQMVRERLAIYKPGGGYIMDGSNSVVFETPEENVWALAEAGREYGRY
jgi:uroporphyrinogen-III decarboxylase